MDEQIDIIRQITRVVTKEAIIAAAPYVGIAVVGGLATYGAYQGIRHLIVSRSMNSTS